MFLGVALPLLFAAAHWLAPRPSSLWLLLLYFTLAIIQLTWLAVWRGVIADFPALLFLCLPFLFLVGPLGWLHARWLRGLPAAKGELLHFIPAVLVLGYALYAFGAWQPEQPLRQPWWLVAASGSGALYMLAVFRPIARLRRPGRLRLERWLVLAFALVGLAVGGAALLGAVNAAFDAVYLALIPLLLVTLFLLEARYPALMAVVSEAVEEEAEAQRYRRSTLAHVDVDAAVACLARLMDEEHLYQNESLSLPALAEAVGITPHQLSELLNEKLERSFSLYLKERRVAAACARLHAEPDEPILDVGLAVGFSSSSAFYAAFREITGKAPGQYRREKAAVAPQ